ncbi:hypothetical protein KL942_004993 [Ogataea angusta]|uniref:Uncharacterized protein n=1 Tax=Pichia angusta TaxID=870730 RepID=A0ABQ7RR26_PICAN|nr:hypothetical protein KL942_004993 [Ogataea angusta]KAG7846018.1 hypothetical protein KL940_004857 [Ogataea angusta]
MLLRWGVGGGVHQVLSRLPLGFRVEHIGVDHESTENTAEHDVITPANAVHGDRVAERRNQQSTVHSHQLNSDALGTQMVREDLRRIRQQQRRVRNVIVEVIDEDEPENGTAVLFGAGLGKFRRASRPDDVRDQHANAREQKQRSAAESVHHEGACHRSHEIEDLQQTIDQRLHVGRGDADGVENEREVVRDNGDSVPLRADTDAERDVRSSPVSGRLHKVQPSGLGGLFLHVERLDDLCHLDVDQRQRVVAVGVVFDKNAAGLGNSSLGHEPSRRLWNEPHEETLDRREAGLQDGGYSPGPRVAAARRAVARPGRQNGAEVPQTPVQRGQFSSEGRIRQLGSQQRHGLHGEHSGGAHQEPRHDHLGHREGGCLDDRGDDDSNKAADQNGFSADFVGEPSDRWQCNQTAAILRCVDESKHSSVRVAEKFPPLLQRLQAVHQRPVVACGGRRQQRHKHHTVEHEQVFGSPPGLLVLGKHLGDGRPDNLLDGGGVKANHLQSWGTSQYSDAYL